MEVYRYFAALAVFVLVIGLSFLVVRWPQGKHVTFSLHAAAYRHTVLYYNLLFTIVLPLLVLFFAGWFGPYFGLSPWFTVFVVASSVAQYIVTLIPETGGWKTRWHRAITALSALCLLPALALVLATPSLSLAARLLTLASLIAMVGIIGYLALIGGRHKYLLFFQAGYYAAFFVPVLLVAYAGI